MEEQKVDMFLMSHAKHFESHHISEIRESILKLDDSKLLELQSLPIKDPTTMLLVSLFGGAFGIDRFMIGDTGLGVGKLLTCGGFGIWSVVDWFMIMGKTREKNYKKLLEIL